jgi:hypothetical protein
VSTAQGQNYTNHVHRPTAWTITWSLAVVAVGLLLWNAVRVPSLQSVALVLLAFVVLAGVTITRIFALRLQDRIIRLEMQVRLARLGRGGDLARLSTAQIVALRFAADAELPALIDRAVTEKLTSRQIKEAVTNWQGDYLRT